jgi:methyl-accepting chemotaxis protein
MALHIRLMALNSVIGAAHANNGGGGPAIEEITGEIGTLTRRLAEEGAALAAAERETDTARAPLDGLVQTMRGHGMATRDILRNAEGAVAAVLSLTNAISRITRTAGETGQVAAAMQGAADEAARRSAKLKNDIDGILARLRP